MISSGQTIFVQSRPQYRGPLTATVRRLKDEFSATIQLFVTSEQEIDHYRNRDDSGVYDRISQGQILYRAVREDPPERERVLAEARANESWLDHTYNELALTDRHLGRGFA